MLCENICHIGGHIEELQKLVCAPFRFLSFSHWDILLLTDLICSDMERHKEEKEKTRVKDIFLLHQIEEEQVYRGGQLD